MDVFQNLPVNKAHLHDRKAEQYLQNSDLVNAIKHYQLASDCINEIVNNKNAIDCSFSLKFQKRRYDKLRKQCEEGLKKKVVKEHEKTPSKFDKVIISSEKFTKEVQNKVNSDLKTGLTPALRYHQTFVEEPDSMLRPLHQPVNYVNYRQQKRPKSDKEVIEELKMRNMDFGNLVTDLMEKNEKLSSMNQDLKNRCNELEMQKVVLQQQLNGMVNVNEVKANSFESQNFFQFDKSI